MGALGELKGGDGGDMPGGGGMSSDVSGMERLRVNFSKGGVRNCFSSSVIPVREADCLIKLSRASTLCPKATSKLSQSNDEHLVYQHNRSDGAV